MRLPKLISDGMVLQRDAPVKTWGLADAGEAVAVEFNGRHYSTEADDTGHWSVTLKPLPAGGPHTMTIHGENHIELADILVGDVWLASGQSNMEYPISRIAHRFEKEIAAVNNSRIRQFRVPQEYDFNAPRADLESGQWLAASQDNIRDFSAVAYFFAAEIQRKLQVPIGIINSSLGGSPAEAWVSEETLKQFPQHLAEKRKFENPALIEKIQREDRARIDQWYAIAAQKDAGLAEGEVPWFAPQLDTAEWAQLSLPGYWAEPTEEGDNGIFWFRKNLALPEHLAGTAGLLELGRIVDADETYINGRQVGSTSYLYPRRRYPVPAGLLRAGENTITVRVTNTSGRGGFVKDKPYALTVAGERFDLRGPWHFRRGARMPSLAPQTFVRWKPGGLFNAMLYPLQNYRIKGAIWYQGESNVGRAEEYKKLFPALIRDWRSGWRAQAGQDSLPFLFVQLANFLEPASTPADSAWAELREAQAAALALPDTGMAVAIDAGEWNDIHPLDKKTVGLRLALAARRVAYGEKEGIYFGPQFHSLRAEGDRLIVTFRHTGGGLKPSDGGPLRHFAIAGKDGHFTWARAEILGDTVRLWSEQVPTPTAVRYAWADNPAGTNLYNSADLPAAPFRAHLENPAYDATTSD
ncbi:beta galactosidase jelly roll domain-containing protein [Microbulbifer thermotolerans]|uniref:sialate O-acetylesterase n=1 Tax=Microbulbifer thermotolerans TaxID=252514 RepID=UPI00224A984C|nr:sialate O-acetylesterase [Microbulbifer thermotolerans]MCX2783048.1 beta galactosidase jelly roll domain-containing protein [Microbulbifer thermotolerans]